MATIWSILGPLVPGARWILERRGYCFCVFAFSAERVEPIIAARQHGELVVVVLEHDDDCRHWPAFKNPCPSRTYPQSHSLSPSADLQGSCQKNPMWCGLQLAEEEGEGEEGEADKDADEEEEEGKEEEEEDQ